MFTVDQTNPTLLYFASFNSSFEFGKRKPAPRVFCDICDEFDQHETEDCPKQCSDSPPESLKHPSSAADPTKERKVPPPRKYCEGCEGKAK